mmetsp:Transcript_40593/g.41277  ORF Transcript_40593/g.41277 Transcript_40593/m.41277 type:complete len:83 (+) Transcript_40593:270-518(+)
MRIWLLSVLIGDNGVLLSNMLAALKSFLLLLGVKGLFGLLFLAVFVTLFEEVLICSECLIFVFAVLDDASLPLKVLFIVVGF